MALVITGFLLNQAGLKRNAADTGTATLIQRFRSTTNLIIYLHDLMLDGVYCTSGKGAPVFHEAAAPSNQQLQTVLNKIIYRILR